MHTALTRANALVAYTMSVLASLTFLCFLSTFFNEYQVFIPSLISFLLCPYLLASLTFLCFLSTFFNEYQVPIPSLLSFLLFSVLDRRVIN